MAEPSAPLAGVRVVGVEQAIAAPLCTRHLADLGADVVKVERRGVGDFARHYDTTVNGLSSHFVWVNRGKRSITLDLKSPDGAAVLAALVDRADVLVSNLGPGAMDRLGYTPDRVRATHPTLVYCAISGYGADGPYRTSRAYDGLLQAETGLLSITGTDKVPSKAGIPVADIAAGMYALSSILAALLRRGSTGEGAFSDVSLLDSLAEWMGYPLHYTVGGGTPPARSGAQHAAIAPYGPYATRDGITLLISVQNDREWRRLCTDVLGRPDLADDSRFATNPDRVGHRDELRALISDTFATRTADQLEATLTEHGVAFGRQRDVAGLADHPQLAARDRWQTAMTSAGPVDVLRSPLSIGTDTATGAVPDLGAHTDEVLAELGYDAQRIVALRDAGVV
jgi:crotonobetainyl-CoA:carnitine CoA-transferase CaiB-like acyl-CoA transferase